MSTSTTAVRVLLLAAVIGLLSSGRLSAQSPSQTPSASPVERLGPNLLRVGTVRVDLAKKEISVSGTINNAMNLEFVANTKGGYKAYESAIELDTSAVNFNTALILIGLDPTHAVPPKTHFDQATPQGDPVEVWVDWDEGGQRRSVRAEQLIYNEKTKQALSDGPWVYTGSAFSTDRDAFLAEADGVLIGFVHTPAPVIESPRPFLPQHFGSIHLNPAYKLTPGTTVTVRVRSLGSLRK